LFGSFPLDPSSLRPRVQQDIVRFGRNPNRRRLAVIVGVVTTGIPLFHEVVEE
jgi:hypothetical protein